MKASMWALSWSRASKETPLRDLLARIENQISTWLSQEAWVGRVVEMHVGVAGEPQVELRLVGGEIVEDDVDLSIGIGGGDLVHEGEEFDPPAPFAVAADDLSGGDIERGEEGGGPVPDVIVRLTGDRSPIRKFEIALRALQRLDRRLFVDRENNGRFPGAPYRGRRFRPPC